MPCDIPAYSLPGVNHQVLLARRPNGIPVAADFTMVETSVPAPGEGEILVRNIYLSVDPAQRGWASAEANYSAPVPLGTPMRALGVGVVLKSHHPDYEPGEFLYGWLGWQDYAVIGEKQIVHRAKEDIPLAGFLALIGIAGTTAYFGLTELGRPKPGDVLLVSTAAGSVGSLVGQLGKSLGCRTIGLTGSDEKAERCRTRFGYDVAINYRAGNLAEKLAEAAPEGINIFFDNVGGAILDTALRHLKVGARVVQCGTASIGAWNPPPMGPRNEREILTRRLIWSGLIVFDYIDRYGEAAAELSRLYKAGKLSYELDVAGGLAAAPGAIAALYAGDNHGKMIITTG